MDNASYDTGDSARKGEPVPEGVKHTPGPWAVEEPAARGAWIKGATGEWTALACGDNDQSAAANARLIVQAPAMLEALRDANRIIADIEDYMKRPDRGDYGVECALCMGELFDDDRVAIDAIRTLLSQIEGARHG